VAVGYGAVWVIVHRARDNELLRIDPATGKVRKRTRFRSSPIDGLAAGLGSVWVTASSSGVLYRINPRSAQGNGPPIHFVGQTTRPQVVLGSIWVSLTASGGDTVIIDPRSLVIVENLGCCSPEGRADTAGQGSIWTADAATGTIERWDGQTHQGTSNIRVASPPLYDGPCLTSIAAGAGAVWVTAAASLNYRC
jgi:DNA-binding beta-propeller fold protein YncE